MAVRLFRLEKTSTGGLQHGLRIACACPLNADERSLVKLRPGSNAQLQILANDLLYSTLLFFSAVVT